MSYQKVSLSFAQSHLYTLIDNQTIQLVSILGIGAYGVVYLGKNVISHQSYAVKLLTHMNISYREADIHAYLSGHPNILTFEKVVYEGSRTFMILEFTPEGDLFTAITKHRKDEIVGNDHVIKYIFLQIIDAVQFCHQNNIAHRDLKPENILLGANLQVKLADFGLATTNLISDEFGCGSTFYFSPECQGAGGGGGFYTSSSLEDNKHVKGYNTHKNDIWSLGVILINLAVGRNPWRQAHLKNPTFAAYVRSPRNFFKTILPCISDELEKILLRIFCLNPARRISLPELKHLIQKSQSFTQPPAPSKPIHHRKSMAPGVPHYPIFLPKQFSPVQKTNRKKNNQHQHILSHYYPYSTTEKNMSYSGSTTETVLHYVGTFTDEEL